MPEGQTPGGTPQHLAVSKMSEMPKASSDLSIEDVVERSDDALHHLDIPVRKRCGIRRMGRKPGITYEYWVPCARRRCTLCAPRLAARRMAAVDDVILYGKNLLRDQWEAEKRQLQRAKARGEDAAYTVIPTGYDTILVVSEAEIGYSIDRSVVETKMLESRTEWGNITSSKDWRPTKAVASREDGFEDVGIFTIDQELYEQAVRFLGLETIETIWDLRWVCDDPEHLALMRAGGVMSDRDYWAMIRLGKVPEEAEPETVWTGAA